MQGGLRLATQVDEMDPNIIVVFDVTQTEAGRPLGHRRRVYSDFRADEGVHNGQAFVYIRGRLFFSLGRQPESVVGVSVDEDDATEDGWKFKGHREPVTCIATTGGLLLTGSSDRTVRVWSINDQATVHVLTHDANFITTLMPSTTNPGALFTGTDQKIFLWEFAEAMGGGGDEAGTTRALQPKAVFTGHTGAITDLFQPEGDSSVLYSASLDATVRAWSTGSQQERFKLAGGHLSAPLRLEMTSSSLFSSSTKLLRNGTRTKRWLGVSTEVELIRKNLSGFKRILRWFKSYSNQIEFFFMVLLIVLDAFQLASFAFTDATEFASEDVNEAVESTQNFGSFSFSYLTTLIIACSVVFSFLILFMVSEWVELKKFINPDSNAWNYVWLSMTYYCKFVSRAFFLAIFGVFLRVFDCTDSARVCTMGSGNDTLSVPCDGGSGSGGLMTDSADGWVPQWVPVDDLNLTDTSAFTTKFVMDADDTVVCWEQVRAARARARARACVCVCVLIFYLIVFFFFVFD